MIYNQTKDLSHFGNEELFHFFIQRVDELNLLKNEIVRRLGDPATIAQEYAEKK